MKSEMNKLITEIQWRKHWLGLSVFVLALILLLFTAWSRSKIQESLKLAPQMYRQQKEINNAAEGAAKILEDNLGLYVSLRDRGVIGSPKRLQLLEVLQRIVIDYQLPEVSFVLSVTQPATAENSPYWNGESPMKLTMLSLDFKLLHEGDLYYLLEELQSQSPGILSVHKCTMNRQLGDSGVRADLTGTCELHWYSINDAIAAWEVQP